MFVSLHVGAEARAHVDHPVDLIVAEGCEGFGDQIDCRIYEY